MELCVGFDFYRIICHKELPDCSFLWCYYRQRAECWEHNFIDAKLKQWSILSYLSVMLLRSLHSKSQCLNEGQCQPMFHLDSVKWLTSVIWWFPSVEWKSHCASFFLDSGFVANLLCVWLECEVWIIELPAVTLLPPEDCLGELGFAFSDAVKSMSALC